MPTESKRLYRSRTERMIAGICSGLGEYFGTDPTVVRLVFVFATLLGGPGLLAYLIMMLVVPEEPLAAVQPLDEPTPESKPRKVAK